MGLRNSQPRMHNAINSRKNLPDFISAVQSTRWPIRSKDRLQIFAQRSGIDGVRGLHRIKTSEHTCRGLVDVFSHNQGYITLTAVPDHRIKASWQSRRAGFMEGYSLALGNASLWNIRPHTGRARTQPRQLPAPAGVVARCNWSRRFYMHGSIH